MASWNVYAQRVRSYNQEIWGAAIFGVDGTLWGQDGVNITNDHTKDLKQDIRTIVEVVNDFENTNSKVFTDGFRFFEKQWAVVRVDAGLIQRVFNKFLIDLLTLFWNFIKNVVMVGKGKAPNSSQFAARKANKCIVRIDS